MTISTGCDNCKYLKGKQCKLWQVKVTEPSDSHCESWQTIGLEKMTRAQGRRIVQGIMTEAEALNS